SLTKCRERLARTFPYVFDPVLFPCRWQAVVPSLARFALFPHLSYPTRTGVVFQMADTWSGLASESRADMIGAARAELAGRDDASRRHLIRMHSRKQPISEQIVKYRLAKPLR